MTIERITDGCRIDIPSLSAAQTTALRMILVRGALFRRYGDSYWSAPRAPRKVAHGTVGALEGFGLIIITESRIGRRARLTAAGEANARAAAPTNSKAGYV